MRKIPDSESLIPMKGDGVITGKWYHKQAMNRIKSKRLSRLCWFMLALFRSDCTKGSINIQLEVGDVMQYLRKAKVY